MKELINNLNERLERNKLRFWYIEMGTYFNNSEDGDITLIELKNTDSDTHIRLWHSELNTEELTEDFLYESILNEILEFSNELSEIRKIVVSAIFTY